MCIFFSQIRKDIQEFKQKNNLDKVAVLWTANTERFCALEVGINDTKENMLASIARGEEEVGVLSCPTQFSTTRGRPSVAIKKEKKKNSVFDSKNRRKVIFYLQSTFARTRVLL